MSVFNVISMLGGLGFFLYGMTLMGSGLKKVAGGKLEGILERLSSTPVRGVLLGAVVTAIIQSSSATTVMVVGFVNSGIMRLTQAIGVIMGANIGTTMTGWILSLSGVQGDVWWLKLFQPSTFSPIIALLGASMVMFAHDKKKKHVGSILLGFAILMYGMSAMSAAANPLAESEAFASVLTLFSNPLLGMLVGMVLTAVIQSASASVGILQALALTGTITYSTAIPLILGMNIGACVPVLLSSIGANKNGRRAAFIYLYYNAIGTAIFMPLFYLVDFFFPLPFMSATATVVGIALFNTFFNTFSTALMTPFVGKLEKLACLTIRDNKRSGETGGRDLAELLDERFLSVPGYALTQCRNVVDRMADLDWFSITSAIGLLRRYDEELAGQIEQNEETVDEYEDKLGTYLVRLSAKSLAESESRDAAKLLHALGDFERISDHSLNLLARAREIRDKTIRFSPAADVELSRLSDAVTEILRITTEAFKNDDDTLAGQVEPLEQVIDLLCAEFKKRHIERLQAGECTVNVGFVYNDILADFERVSDHCSNIAVTVIRLKDELYDTHEYLNRLKSSSSGAFREQFDRYKAEYYDAFVQNRQ